MTTKKDNFKLRNQKLGTGLEESLGVPRKGFQDPTGEFPVSYTHLRAHET